MEKIRLYEKNPNELNKNNLFRNGEINSHGIRKIDNLKWSLTNECLRSSTASNDPYDRINDGYSENAVTNGTLNNNTKIGEHTIEDTRVHTRGIDADVNTSNRIENAYLTFSKDFPETPSSVKTGIYSYATNGQICFTNRQSDESGNLFSSLEEDNDKGHHLQMRTEYTGEQTGQRRNAPKQNQAQYNNDRMQFNENSTAHIDMSEVNVDKNGQYDNTFNIKDTYMVPEPEKKMRKPLSPECFHEKKLPNNNGSIHRISERNEYDIPDDTNSLRNTNKSYSIQARIPEPDRKCSKTRILIVVVILVILMAGVASIVTYFITKPDGRTGDCVDGNGCTSTCQKYPDVLNGHVTLTDVLSAHVTCDPGFMVNGNDTALCQSNGYWNVMIRCEPVDCGMYQPPLHVRVIEEVYATSVNTTVHLKCDTGFQFEKQTDNFVSCNENGTWNGDPKCENLVEFSVRPTFILIGNIGTLTCKFHEIPNWQKIEFRRISVDNDSLILITIDNLIDSYDTKISGENIKVQTPAFTHDSGEVVVVIDTVQCNDVFDLPGDVKYACYVFYENSLTSFDENTIRIQGQLTAPSLTISQQVVENQDTQLARAFVCEMYFPEPDGHIVIESDYGGEFAELLTTVNGEYETDVAWIEQIKTSVKNCWHWSVVTFGLKSVSMKWHRKHIRCVSKPSDQSLNKTVLVSKGGAVKVIPEDFCYGKGKDILRHPYNCSLFVVCDMDDSYNTVKEVPAACNENVCFNIDSRECKSCDIVGGCSITDIYFKDGNTITVGSSLTIICIIEDYEGLEDIKITRGNGELVSSLNAGNNIKGFVTLSNRSHLNTTSGVLSLYVDHVLCIDDGTYRCFPEGSGKPSDDSINIDLNC